MSNLLVKNSQSKKILVTGSTGFLGKNLLFALTQNVNYEILTFNKDDSIAYLLEVVQKVDVIIFLHGINRSKNQAEFNHVNFDILNSVCKSINEKNKDIQIIFASSIQALEKNAYGNSKLMAENALIDFSKRNLKSNIIIYRLPGIFGKWSRPNYNSVVATFCHNISRNIPIEIREPNKIISLVYVDDVINDILNELSSPQVGLRFKKPIPEHIITIKDLADKLRNINELAYEVNAPVLSDHFMRALYSTFQSFMPIEKSAYFIPHHTDSRGSFVEFHKSIDFGQMSYLTANPGVTRGGHFHHSKVEKFLVVKGLAKFKFVNVISNEKFEVFANATNPQIIHTLPGWAHDITNIGSDEMIAIVWSSEVFDPNRPDTIKMDIQ